MTQPFLGQIQPFAINFAPRGWAQCNGQTMAISQNSALFALLGTMYGGNGQTNFALPDLQGRVPLHSGSFAGSFYQQGQAAGQEAVTLNLSQLPAHNHGFLGSPNKANDTQPAAGAALANIAQKGGAAGDPYYAPDTTPQPLNPASISVTGGNQGHNNLQPYLTINWCIALNGIFPSRN